MTQLTEQTTTEAIKPPIKTHSKENPFIVESMNILQGESNNLKTDKPVYHNLLSLIKESPDYVQTNIPKIKQIIQNKYVNPLSVAEHIVLNDQKWKHKFNHTGKYLFSVAENIIKEEAITKNYFSEVYFKKTGDYFNLDMIKMEKIILNSPNPLDIIVMIHNKDSFKKRIKRSFKHDPLYESARNIESQFETAFEHMNSFYNKTKSESDFENKVKRTIRLIPDQGVAQNILLVNEYLSEYKPEEFEKVSFTYVAAKEFIKKSGEVKLLDVN